MRVSGMMGILLGIQALLLYLNPLNLPIQSDTRVIICLTVAASILYIIAASADLQPKRAIHILGGVIAAAVIAQIVLDAFQNSFFAYTFFIYGSLVFFNSLLFLIAFSIFS
ncbi:hypothetical protein BpJC4_08820 [Weizmannia acidilactici]|jgi:hypothetical protein|uniref:hypothetical protein n=1 Tax=Weizmannia acidilactici TaxID=2607726 RepID=UPI00124F1E4A|nr:hypothetical protein [Weizmannia acidilactici]GER66411.1 hypothetical protein BpJC4_08820 [Weizmannia acidilactici]